MIAIPVVILLVIIGIYGVSYFAAYRVIHQPRQPILKTLADYGLDYESFSCTSTEGISLKGWWVSGSNSAAIFGVHGYGANQAGWAKISF